MKELVLAYLKLEPRFRERTAKNRGIADILIKRHGLDIDRKVLASLISEAMSADRAWRMILSDDEHKNLRGKDYDDKIIVEQSVQIGLGYEPGFHSDLKIGKTL